MVLDFIYIPLIIMLGIGFISMFKKDLTPGNFKALQYLFFFHLLIGAYYCFFIPGDAIGYWRIPKSYSFLTFTEGIFNGEGTQFMRALNFPFTNLLGMSYLSNTLLFSLFGFIWAMMDVNRRFSSKFTPIKLTIGLKIFLILGGISLFVAWLPDIIQSYFTGKFPLTVYHTPITHVLDMAVISPAIFICFYLLKKQRFLGVQILVVMLVCILLISIMLPVQSVFQLTHGVNLTLAEILTKVAIFVLLGGFASVLFYKTFLKGIKYEESI